MATLSRFAAGSIDQDSYLQLNMPFPIGTVKPEFAEKFFAVPTKGHTSTPTGAFAGHGQAGAEEAEEINRGLDQILIESRADLAEENRTHNGALLALHRSLLNLDRYAIGGDKIFIGVAPDDRPISSSQTKAPLWHMDYMPEQVVARDEDALLPPILSPIVRAYLVRLAPADCPENVQPEFVADRHLSKAGKADPLAVKAFRQAGRARLIRQHHSHIPFYEWEAFMQSDPHIAKVWNAHKQEACELEAEMRAEGLIRQPQRYEVMVGTNYTLHRSKMLTHSTPSLFYGLLVHGRA
jgi:hypothetical protein